jgi:hypothetical protein
MKTCLHFKDKDMESQKAKAACQRLTYKKWLHLSFSFLLVRNRCLRGWRKVKVVPERKFVKSKRITACVQPWFSWSDVWPDIRIYQQHSQPLLQTTEASYVPTELTEVGEDTVCPFNSSLCPFPSQIKRRIRERPRVVWVLGFVNRS